MYLLLIGCCPSQRQLLCVDAPVKLGGRAFDVLVALVERRDRTVSKNELMDLVWPKVVVEENNLEVQVVTLRKLLGYAAIATVPGRGYRFTLPVEQTGTVGVQAGDQALVAGCEARSVESAGGHSNSLWPRPRSAAPTESVGFSSARDRRGSCWHRQNQVSAGCSRSERQSRSAMAFGGSTSLQ